MWTSIRCGSAVAALCLASPGAPARASFPLRLSYETGPAYVAQNDGRYGAAGTAYGAAELGQQKNLARVERAAIELRPGRHRFAFTFTARFYGGGADVPAQQLRNWANFTSATAGLVLAIP